MIMFSPNHSKLHFFSIVYAQLLLIDKFNLQTYP